MTPRAGTPSSLSICQVNTRSPTPIWGAARPTPWAASMVSNMSATSLRELVVELLHGLGPTVEHGLAR